MKRRQELESGRKPIRQLFAIITLLLQAYDSNRSIIHNHDYPEIVRQSHSLIRVTQRGVSMLRRLFAAEMHENCAKSKEGGDRFAGKNRDGKTGQDKRAQGGLIYTALTRVAGLAITVVFWDRCLERVS